jgi:broad specificity phosphatase PhoE
MPFPPTLSWGFIKGLSYLMVFITLATSTQQCGSEPAEVQTAPEKPTTVILVRHAEKGYGEDPHLTPDGIVRANRLQHMLRGLDLSAVYSTAYLRCLETAEPTAREQALEVQLYDPNQLAELAGKLRRRHNGETVLVVGHSNTTPAMVGLFDQQNDYPNIPETDYSYLYIVTLPEDAPAKVLELHF